MPREKLFLFCNRRPLVSAPARPYAPLAPPSRRGRFGRTVQSSPSELAASRGPRPSTLVTGLSNGCSTRSCHRPRRRPLCRGLALVANLHNHQAIALGFYCAGVWFFFGLLLLLSSSSPLSLFFGRCSWSVVFCFRSSCYACPFPCYYSWSCSCYV